MKMCAWVRRVIGADDTGDVPRSLAPGPWQLVATGQDRQALEEWCRQHFPGREVVVLEQNVLPIAARKKG